ncbi:Hypothetical predicted protein [Mytilus galloprovincialis]|uniref:Uncharacterized protein n=1 Tax=Mytilus galloprovincialis TaxID=29158 RepID=A0A8B6HNC0_MYTGA|nr:Hypothetical predicted protein [Mytilus galloprovincialis]
MLAEYHASPDDRVVSLPLETNSTKFETSPFVVELEKCQSIKDTLTYIQSILRHIKTIYNTEERKRVLSNMNTRIEHTVQSTDISVLQEYLHIDDSVELHIFLFEENNQPLCLFCLIAYHVLVASEIENSTQMLNVIKRKLLVLYIHFYVDCIFQLYIDVYYKDNHKDIFTNIHSIWKCDKVTELNLKLAYCKNLFEAKDYKTLLQLIHHHADNLIESFEEIEHELCNSSTSAMVLLHVLHYQVSLNKMERVKTITTILSRPSMKIKGYDEHDQLNGFYDFLLTLDNKQLLCTPYVIKLFHSLMKKQPLNYLCMILLSSDRLRQANHYTECIKFIKSNFQFISSFPTEKLKIQEKCYYRQQYCITLLLLLNEYVTCYDTHKINLMLTKLLDFRESFLSDIQSTSCYCFMGNKQCMAVGNNSQSRKRSRYVWF